VCAKWQCAGVGWPGRSPIPVPAQLTLTPLTPTTSQSQIMLPGTDAQGFLNSSARCDPQNPPAVMARTTKSLLVVCQTGPGSFYYRGVRLSDGASIELSNVVHSSEGGTSPTRPTARGTRYGPTI
jgi:hypothetical protein